MTVSRDVQDYYEANTRRFLRYGGAGAATGSLHRSLRMPGAGNARGEINAVHQVLLDQLATLGIVPPVLPSRELRPSPRVADLGCGVGATMQWLVERAGVEAAGITLSPVQTAIASARMPPGCRVVTGSFTDAGDLRRMTRGRTVNAAYMIESFAHTGDPAAVFRSLQEITVPGSALLICDDFPTERLLRDTSEPAPDAGPHRKRIVAPPARSRPPERSRLNRRLARDFRRGWRIHGFESVRNTAALAERNGWRLIRTVDLTEFVVTTRLRDYVARSAAIPARVFGTNRAWWANVVGGAALQRLIRRRLVRYAMIVLVREH